MRRQNGWVLGGGLLLVGLVAGLSLDEGRIARTAHARNLTAEEAVRLSHELQATDRSLVSGNEELAKVVRLMRPSVVHIESRRPSSRGGTIEETGSGVIVTLPGASGLHVVTNRHVVADSPQLTSISIQLYDGRFLNPTHVWQDKATDVAVLRLPEVDAVPARWGDSDGLEIGHLVMALGSPFGLSQSVSLGIVSAKGRRSLALGPTGEMLNQDFIQTDAAINPGNSGGPLVDLHGRVVGINTAIASNSGGNEGIAFSVPSQLARRVAEALVKFGKVPRAYLGVKLDPDFSAETARRFRLERLRGTRVVQVYEKTPAARASLQIDDVVLEFNGIEVQDENHLINLVSLTPIGKTIRLSVLRSGRILQLDIVLADRTELDGQATMPQTNRPTQTLRPTGFFRELPEPRLHPIDPAIARQIGFGDDTTGLVVLDPGAEGPFADHLRPYDVLVEAARSPLRSVSDWESILRTHSGRELIVKVRRVEENGTIREFLVVRSASEAPKTYRSAETPRGVVL
ncbi:MAG: trypsin-like peptidase domain-containing protein [Planctomycetaceae bacterium]